MWPALIGAGASLLGGLLGRSSAQETADKNIALQREFAQSGIQWKVADAQKAGIHPLYALGAQTHSFAPVSVGDPLPAAMASMGQNLSRAVSSTSTEMQRQVHALTIEGMSLDNDMKRSQIARLNAPAVGPPMQPAVDPYRMEGQPGSGLKVEPLKVSAGAPGGGFAEPGAVSDVGYVRTPSGFAPVPSKDAKDRIEDVAIPSFMWGVRNNLLPNLGNMNFTPPPVDPGKGNVWVWNPLRQEYQSHPRNSWTARLFGRMSDVFGGN